MLRLSRCSAPSPLSEGTTSCAPTDMPSLSFSSNKEEPASLLYGDEPAEATLPQRGPRLCNVSFPLHPSFPSSQRARSSAAPSFTMHCMRICLQTSHVARMARGRTALPTHQTGLWRASGRGESQRECRLCVPLCHAPGPIGRDLELAYRGGWGPGRFTGAGICRFASRLQAYLLRAPSTVSATSYPYIPSALCGACSRVLAACRLPSPAIGLRDTSQLRRLLTRRAEPPTEKGLSYSDAATWQGLRAETAKRSQTAGPGSLHC